MCPSLQYTVEDHVLRHVEVDDKLQWFLLFVVQLVIQHLCLTERTWETVKKPAGAQGRYFAAYQRHHDLVRHQAALLNHCGRAIADLCLALNVSAQNISCRYHAEVVP